VRFVREKICTTFSIEHLSFLNTMVAIGMRLTSAYAMFPHPT
jgi:hypothetical protein